VFAQSASHGFVNFDDAEYVAENPTVARGVTAEGFVWSFTHFRNGNWHPLTWLSHMVDCQIYGVKDAAGQHLTGVLLHAINAVLLFLVLRAMTSELWPSAFVAALFGIHPLHVESVAWVAERKDVLSGLFFMLSLAAYAGYTRQPFSIMRYLLVTIAFALGLMAKPMLVTLPFVFLLLDYWPLARIPRRSASGEKGAILACDSGSYSRVLLEKLPWLALSAISCIVTYFAQSATASVWQRMAFLTRISNALMSYVVYLRQFFWPEGLAAFYPHPQQAAPSWQVGFALAVLLAISAAFLACCRKCPYLLVGWLWYLGMLVPVIGLVQVGAQARADRYSYLPQIGIYIAVAWGAGRMVSRRSVPTRSASEAAISGPRWRFGLVSFVTSLILAMSIVTAWRQTAYWKDGVTLWSRVVACTLPNSWPHNNLGAALAAQRKIDEAMDQFLEALAIDPDDEDAHINLGHAYFEKALKIKPEDELTLRMRNGLLDKAIEYFQRAVKLVPNDAEVRTILAAAIAERQKSANPQVPQPRRDQH
jgi:tetratricopeptide (TPR) repeat protein